ncbi:MAG: TIGR01212 family radical SAM protein [Lachnospiraceae bacterium]|nr:TIGR01212 family radical SAM protein [Lachnospiraceae bacterium]
MKKWNEKPYHGLNYELQKQFGEKLYKITLNPGMTCPNRDGTVGTGGCIFCSVQGSGDFAGNLQNTISEQIKQGKIALSQKRSARSYIAYFQAFTNTYGPIDFLKKIYFEAIHDPDVKILSIATRPDCLDDAILDLLKQINKIKPVWIELGLQSIHETTARYIRRGYALEVFDHAVWKLQKAGICVIVHIILCLPNETPEMMLETIAHLNKLNINGIKLQLLHILKGTDLASEYQKKPFWIPNEAEYLALLANCVAHLKPNITIHRLTGDGPKDLLIAPLWSSAKRTVLNHFHQYLKEHDIWQGKEYYE